MVEYGCNVTNKYGFMSDDDEFDDPQELEKKMIQHEADKAAAQKKADKAAAAKPAVAAPVKEVSKPAGKENRPERGGERGGDRGRGGRGLGRGRGGPREGGAPRPPREDLGDRFGESRGRGRGAPRGGDRGARTPFRGRGGNVNTSGSEEHVKEHNISTDESSPQQDVAPEDGGFGGRGRRGGGRGGVFSGERRGRGAPGTGFRGARQYDRQSGSDRTGVRGTDKKDGHGKGNWGSDKDELAGETEPVVVEEKEPEPPREKTAEELAFEAAEAEIAKQKTLKEFKAALKSEEPKFNTRKAGEGTQENFGKLVPLKKDIIDDKDDEEVVIVRKEGRKQLLNIDIQFTDPSRNRDNRDHRDRGERDRGDRPPRGGGRGGPRGAGQVPRGGRGGARQAGGVPFDSSLEAFPALGAK